MVIDTDDSGKLTFNLLLTLILRFGVTASRSASKDAGSNLFRCLPLPAVSSIFSLIYIARPKRSAIDMQSRAGHIQVGDLGDISGMGVGLAARLTKEDRLQRLVEKTRRRVDETPPSARLLKHMPSSKLGALIREAGYLRSSRRLLDELSDRLRLAGVDFCPDLLDTDNTTDTKIYFFDVARSVKGLQPARQLFKEEAQLSQFLWMNKHFLSQAMKNLRLRDREKMLAPGSRPDLVALDTKSRELVGIELKAGEPDQGIVAQAAKYMSALKTQAESEGLRGARLMIITGQPDDQLADLVQLQSAKVGVKCEWLLYRVRFELSRA